MPHSKQAKKRVRTSEERRDHNRSLRSTMRTAIKGVESAVEQKNTEDAKAALADAMLRIDKCAKRNIIHENNASRKKSSLARLVATLA